MNVMIDVCDRIIKVFILCVGLWIEIYEKYIRNSAMQYNVSNMRITL